MVELGIVGAKNSGKTTVVKGLTRYLVGKGYGVATIKHTSHSHQFDTPGKDTFHHRQAGASLTIAAGKDEIAIFAEPNLLNITELQNMTRDQIHIWLIEGDRNASRSKILVTRHLSEMSDILPGNIVATIGPERLDKVSVFFEADDYHGLGDFVISAML